MLEAVTTADLVRTLLMAISAAFWPPAMTGALWIIAGIYALASILFDDETMRGNPGIDYSAFGKNDPASGEMTAQARPRHYVK